MIDLKDAISTSRIESRIVHIYTNAPIADVIGELSSMDNGTVDYARQGDGSYDVWGRDWRLCVTVSE